MSTRPFIIEALVPEMVASASADSDNVNNDDRRAFRRSFEHLETLHPWLDEANWVLSRVVWGACHREAGLIRLRLLACARQPLDEMSGVDGETLVVRAPVAEVFESDRDAYYVTSRRMTRIDGSFSYSVFQGHDGMDIADLRLFVMPHAISEVRNRACRLLGLGDMPPECATTIQEVLANNLDERHLLSIDHYDLEDYAEEVAKGSRETVLPTA